MQTLNVYAKARIFVLVPLCDDVECSPVERVELVVGRDSVGMLAEAMRDVLARCDGDVTPWDGENGLWHSHHLVQATLTWADDRAITAMDEDGTQASFPAGQERKAAEWLIKRVGARLH